MNSVLCREREFPSPAHWCIRLRVIFDFPGRTTLMLLTALRCIAAATPKALGANQLSALSERAQTPEKQRIRASNSLEPALSETRIISKLVRSRVNKFLARPEPCVVCGCQRNVPSNDSNTQDPRGWNHLRAPQHASLRSVWFDAAGAKHAFVHDQVVL